MVDTIKKNGVLAGFFDKSEVVPLIENNVRRYVVWQLVKELTIHVSISETFATGEVNGAKGKERTPICVV